MNEENQDISLAEALSSLTDMQYRFWQLMDSGKMTQVQAYREAFNTKTDNDNTVAVNASKLWNSNKFLLIKHALAATKITQAAIVTGKRLSISLYLRHLA